MKYPLITSVSRAIFLSNKAAVYNCVTNRQFCFQNLI
jgi:hypothetical protein